jgi:hypothetical protein
MIAVDLVAFAQTLLLHDTACPARNPRRCANRLPRAAARLTRGQRRRAFIYVRREALLFKWR